MRIGDRIRQIRMLKGLTQAELGEKIHLKGDRIRQYENSVRTPKADKIAEIAAALDVDVSVFSDLDISSDEKIMQIFFELEEKLGLHLKKEEHSFSFCFEDDGRLSDSLKNYLDMWFEKSEKDTPELTDSQYEVERKKKDYISWKLRFPSLIQGENSQEEIYYRYQPLVDKLSDNCPPMRVFSDMIKQLTKMMQAGIEMSFESRQVKYAVLEGRISFSDQQLLSLTDPADSYFAEFLCDIQSLEKYGMKIRLESHSDGDRSYSDYVFKNNEIGTILSGMKKIQEQIKEGKFDTQRNQIEYEDFIKGFNISIEDSI